jgi:hypothetical protein
LHESILTNVNKRALGYKKTHLLVALESSEERTVPVDEQLTERVRRTHEQSMVIRHDGFF